MTVSNKFAAAFNNIINRAGAQIKVQRFTQSFGSVWDDDVTLTQTGGDLWTSGVVLLNHSYLYIYCVANTVAYRVVIPSDPAFLVICGLS